MTSTGLLDANILYPAPMRDLFLQLAVTDIFKARWTADIHREWIDALMRTQPLRDRAALERTRELMDSNVRDCLVTGYGSLIPIIELPDPNDRHIVAAAIAGEVRCDCDAEPKTFPGSYPRTLRHRCRTPGRVSVQSLQSRPAPLLQRRKEGAQPPEKPTLHDR